MRVSHPNDGHDMCPMAVRGGAQYLKVGSLLPSLQHVLCFAELAVLYAQRMGTTMRLRENGSSPQKACTAPDLRD